MSSEIQYIYTNLLSELKEKIKLARQRASLSVNKELLKIYWEIGNIIISQKAEKDWGSKVIKQLSIDLRTEFPDMRGFSERNLVYMQTFAAAYPQLFTITQAQPAQIQTLINQDDIILPVAPAQNEKRLVIDYLANLSWYHHTTILDKVKEPNHRLFYIQKTIENGWSRDVMVHQIESNLHHRQGALTHNFNRTLPAYQSELTQQLFKDPYHLDFIMLGESAKERDLENALSTHITNFLIELGDGFAFMGRQKKFEAGGKEFFVDLLFYHTKLRRHIIIELKIGDFESEFVGKMNTYLGLADDHLKGQYDEPSIGLILCKTKNKIIAEYALRDTSKAIGIAEYKIAERLPENIKGELPSIEEIEQRIDEEIKANANPTEKRFEKLQAKIMELNNEAIKTTGTFEIIESVFVSGIKPFFLQLIQELEKLDDLYLSKNLSWYSASKAFNTLDEIQNQWLDEEYLKTHLAELNFSFRLFGFKKAGTEAFNSGFDIKINFGTYSYDFTLVNHNNQQPFYKKLYHQPLTTNDITFLTETVYNKLMDEIEFHIDRLNNNSK